MMVVWYDVLKINVVLYVEGNTYFAWWCATETYCHASRVNPRRWLPVDSWDGQMHAESRRSVQRNTRLTKGEPCWHWLKSVQAIANESKTAGGKIIRGKIGKVQQYKRICKSGVGEQSCLPIRWVQREACTVTKIGGATQRRI